jgi:Tol biopolymer transport system component
MSGRAFLAIGVVAVGLLDGASAELTSANALESSAKIAYACNGNICVMRADGTGRRQLTHDKFIDTYPTWSPDGQEIAFTGLLRRAAIYVMNSDGSRRRRLTAPGADEALAAWSTDAQTIAFDDNSTGTIELLRVDGRRRRALTPRPASLPAWSPDGKRIAFVSSDGRRLALTTGDIYVINADGSGRRRLTQHGSFPAWSPDGTRIAFSRNARTGSDSAIWIVNADGSDSRLLWHRSAIGGGLSWSPDGTRIAFTWDSEIYAVNVDGSGLRRLTRCCGDNLNPAWQALAR